MRVALATLCLLTGCTAGVPEISQFPIPVDVDAGPVVVGVQIGEDDRFLGTVDTMAPLTIIDSFIPGAGEIAVPRRRTLDIGIQRSGPASDPPVTQALLRGVDTLDLHPCLDPQSTAAPGACVVGVDSTTRTIRGVLGADTLSRYATRFDVSRGELTFFPDIAGDNRDRALMCEAVFPSPFQGAGTLIIGGAEKPYSARRITLGACFLNVNREAGLASAGQEPPVATTHGIAQGLDALFLLSSGQGMTVVAESTYQQYKLHEAELTGSTPASDPGQAITIHLASGPIVARLGEMSHLSLVAEFSDQRGPCYERYANAFLTRLGRCTTPDDPACPCSGGSVVCRAGAVVELCGAFPVAVVPDDAPLLQGLRDELRPALPEVDGILGTDIMAKLIIDVDYPNGRVLLRCAPGAAGCNVRPFVLTQDVTMEVEENCPAPVLCSVATPVTP